MIAAPTRTDFAAARRAMLDSQLRTSGVNEAFVLARMGAVPREDHVPAAARDAAYVDRAIPLGEDRFLPAPLVQARLLAEARPTLADSALVIDAGSGYLAALVGPLVGTMKTIAPEDADKIRRPASGYTLILVDGAIEHLPAALEKALADGGRVVTGLAERGVTRLAIGRKAGSAVAFLPLADIGMPRLAAFDRPSGWSF